VSSVFGAGRTHRRRHKPVGPTSAATGMEEGSAFSPLAVCARCFIRTPRKHSLDELRAVVHRRPAGPAGTGQFGKINHDSAAAIKSPGAAGFACESRGAHFVRCPRSRTAWCCSEGVGAQRFIVEPRRSVALCRIFQTDIWARGNNTSGHVVSNLPVLLFCTRSGCPWIESFLVLPNP